MDTKKVSIVVPIVPFDDAIKMMTDECLSRLVKYTYKNNITIEIIVVINGKGWYSIDKELGNQFPNVTFKTLTFPDMIGNPGAWNRGFEASSGHIICFMDNDVYVTDDWFAPVMSALEDPKCGVVVPDVWKLINGAWRSMNDSYQGCCIITRRDALETLSKGDESRNVPSVLTPFDEAFNPAYFEDNDLFMRFHKLGFNRHWAKDSKIYHHNETTCTVVLDKDREQHFENSKQTYIKRWGDNNFLAPQEGAA